MKGNYRVAGLIACAPVGVLRSATGLWCYFRPLRQHAAQALDKHKLKLPTHATVVGQKTLQR